jgi:hypothetical protein
MSEPQNDTSAAEGRSDSKALLSVFDDDNKNIEILAEEAAEIIVELGKIIQMKAKIYRFGLNFTHPKYGDTNRDHLEQEVGDFLAMVDVLKSRGIFTDAGIDLAKKRKLEKLQHWYR